MEELAKGLAIGAAVIATVYVAVRLFWRLRSAIKLRLDRLKVVATPSATFCGPLASN